MKRGSEFLTHIAIVDLLRFKGRVLFYHVPNGEDRSPIIGAKLRRMGVLPGVADLGLVLPDGRAAFLEVKSDNGRQTLQQQLFQAAVEATGALYAVVRSVDEAEAVLASWDALRVRRAA